MKFGFFFLGLVVIGVMFEAATWVDDNWLPGQRDFFLFADHKMHFSSIVYYTIEHVVYFLLGLFIYSFVHVTRPYSMAFCMFEILDIGDFFATANGSWFFFMGLPVTFNVIKVVVFVLLIIWNYAASRISSS